MNNPDTELLPNCSMANLSDRERSRCGFVEHLHVPLQGMANLSDRERSR